MKLNKILLLISFMNVSLCFAQTDTLIINNQKISCAVKEVTADAVRFTYPNEDVINTVYKNTVQKIIFKSGRVQTFMELTSFKKVSGVEDYENVTITALEGEVKGLYKLGDVSAKAKGTTTLSNQERVKERAYRKMKIEAAMLGANIIYLTNQRSEGNKFGGYYQSGSATETSLTGIAYTNQLANIEDFKRLLNNRTEFLTVQMSKMWSSDSDVTIVPYTQQFKIYNIINDNGIITIEGKLAEEDKYTKFRLASLTENDFSIYYQNKSTSYNYKFKF